MAVIDERMIDPEPDVLVKLLRRATAAANGRRRDRRLDKDGEFWQGFVQRAARSPEGHRTWKGSRSDYLPSSLVKAAWWTDPVGRRHWRVLGRAQTLLAPVEDAALAAFPLWHVYPDRLALRRQGDRVTLLARCDCGMAGAIDGLGWTGERCGPCHDRIEEGAPAAATFPPALNGHGIGVTRLAFGGADRLVSGGYDGRVIRWDLSAGGHEVLLHRRRGTVHAVALSPGGRVAASTASGRVLLRDADSAEWRTLPLSCGHVGWLAFSPDERWLAVAGSSCWLIDLNSTRPDDREVMPGEFAGPVCFSADGRTLWATDIAETLCRVDVFSGAVTRLRGRPEAGPGEFEDFLDGLDGLDISYPYFRSLACSADGRYVAAVVSWDGWFGTHVGDLRTNQWFGLRESPAVISLGLAFTAGGELLSLDSDGMLRVWDLARRELRAAILAEPPRSCSGASAFSADGETLALALHGGAIRAVPWRAMSES